MRLGLIVTLSLAGAYCAVAQAKSNVLLTATALTARREVDKVAGAIRRAGYAVETVYDMTDAMLLQRAVDKLTGGRVDKIAVVPLAENSDSDACQQLAYIAGVNKEPSKGYMAVDGDMRRGGQGAAQLKGFLKQSAMQAPDLAFGSMSAPVGGGPGVRQIKSKAALAVISALDESPVVVEVLTERVRKLSKRPADEVVVLIGRAPADEDARQAWSSRAEAVASAVKQKGGFRDVRALGFPIAMRRQDKQTLYGPLREYVAKQRAAGLKVIVQAYAMDMGGFDLLMKEALPGGFYKISKAAILPHPSVERWILERVAEISKQ
ncbi:MAG: hypothetical protein AABZ44_03000 [Elusimicrobiota bacterium]